MFENLKKAIKRTNKTCPKCEQETLSPWIIITPDGETLDIGWICKIPSCKYEWFWKPQIVFDAYKDAKDKDINWWFFHLITAIEYCIITHQNQTITEEAWRSVSPILKYNLAIQFGERKYGKSDPQKIDPELIAPDTLIEAVPKLEDEHLCWRLRPKSSQNLIMEKLFGYYFAGY